MALNPQTPSKHNQMITRFIKHPKSTNFDGNKEQPAKRQKTSGSPKKAPPTPREFTNHKVPDSDADDDDSDIKREPEEQKERTVGLESALPQIKADDEAIEAYEAFKASQGENAEGAEVRLEKRAWVRGKSSLYVDAFNLALDTVLDEEGHLFDEGETELFRIWRELGYEAQYL
jgi:Fanconi-associated nuclease 1